MQKAESDSTDLTVLVTPVWNDSARLAEFGEELATALADANSEIRWIVADDGSSAADIDQLESLVDQFSKVYPHVRLHKASAHRGKGSVIREAWATEPTAAWLAFVDADGSLPAPNTVRFIEVAKSGDNTLLGIRKRTEETTVVETFGRSVAHHLYILATRVLVGLHCSDPQCGAKVLHGGDYRQIADQLIEPGLAFDSELLATMARAGLTWREQPVTWHEKPGGLVRPTRDAWPMLAALWRIRQRLRRTE